MSDAQQISRRVAWRAVALVAQHTSIAEGDLALRIGGDVGLMRHQQDRDAMLIQRLEHRHDLQARAAVQVAGRLVRQQQRGTVDQRTGDGDTLLLPARELERCVVGARGEPDEF